MRKMRNSIIAEVFKDEIDEAKAESREKNLIENIRSLMETLNFTAKQAMDALKIPANEQNKYLALIQKTIHGKKICVLRLKVSRCKI